jgi:23S rRNA pseudouridine1911/1915/1917 synthase
MQKSRNAQGPRSVPILYRGEGFLVVDKPAGLPTEPTRDPTRPNVLSVLRGSGEVPGDAGLGVPHRLDRDTSGALVVSIRADLLPVLNESLKARLWRKSYVAVVHGIVERDEFRIESFLAPVGRRAGIERHGSVRSGGKKAITIVRVRERHARTTLVECLLETGRTHQIRVHLSEAGHPLIGDEFYGAPAGEQARVGRHLLHAFRLELPNPASPEESIVVESPMPAPFRKDY